MSTDQQKLAQLISPYSPMQPPQFALDFGDYLSLLWRIDASAGHAGRETYYRRCALALAQALDFEDRSLGRLVRVTETGSICASLETQPYRGTGRLVDAQDRRDAIRQLVNLRGNILEMGAYRENWMLGWPGSRMADQQLRERLFAVFFTAFDGQFRPFSRLLLVIDIVLQELLLGNRAEADISLSRLIREFGFPDPGSPAVQELYNQETG